MKPAIPVLKFCKEIEMRSVQSVCTLEHGKLYKINGLNFVFSVYTSPCGSDKKIVLHSSYTNLRHVLYSADEAEYVVNALAKCNEFEVMDFVEDDETTLNYQFYANCIALNKEYKFRNDSNTIVLLPEEDVIILDYDYSIKGLAKEESIQILDYMRAALKQIQGE